MGRATTAQSREYQWLDIGPDNPFDVRVLDIRPLTQTLASVTQDPDVARSFVELRQSDGSDLPGVSTETWVSVPCHLDIPLSIESADGPLFKASEMEDKWDIYAIGSVLYFARSWVGSLIYRAPFRAEDGSVVIRQVESAPEHSDKADQTVFYLLVSHVLGKPFPNPFPGDLGDDAEPIALHSFSSFGRRAICATREDVTSAAIPDSDK